MKKKTRQQKKEMMKKKKLNKRFLHQKCSRLRLSPSFFHQFLCFSWLLLSRCRQIGCVNSQCPPLPPDPPAPTPLVSSAQRCYNKKSALWCFVLPARSHNIVSTRRRGLNVWWLAWPRRSSLRTTAAKLHQVVSKIDTRKCIWLQLQSITDQEKKGFKSRRVNWWSANELIEFMTSM